MSSNHQSVERCEHPSIVDELCSTPACARYCRVLRVPSVQHPGIVFSVMACMCGNRDRIDVCGSPLVSTKKVADQLWPLPIVYSALVCVFSCTLWLIFFK